MAKLSAGRRRREGVGLFFTLAVFVMMLVPGGPLHQSRAAQAAAGDTLWISAYYPGWQQEYLPPTAIDFGAITHLMHFSLVPIADGSVNTSLHSLSAANVSTAVAAAHGAGRQIVIVVGGAGYDAGFRGAASSANRAQFVANLVGFMNANGYDGIDIDWEPLQWADAAAYQGLVTELRAAIGANKLLTTALPVTTPLAILTPVRDLFDQINLMTYDYSSTYDGWTTVWHNAALFNGGQTHPSTGGPLPAADLDVTTLRNSGVASAKIGIGLDWYGYVWRGGAGTSTGGVTAPGQQFTSPPTVEPNVAYSTIMRSYYNAAYRHWDTTAQAVYLGINYADDGADLFVSYDDEQSGAAKVAYARQQGLGGIIIWELGGGYRAELPAGQRDPLLQALKISLAPSPTPSPSPTPTRTPTLTPTSTFTPSPTRTPTLAPTMTSTPLPTRTPTAAPTSTFTPTPTRTPILSPSPTRTVNPLTPPPAATSTPPAIVQHLVAVTVVGGGVVGPVSGEYPAGTSLSFTPRAQPGQLFTGWTLDGVYVGYAAPLTITIDGPHTLAAQFVAQPTFVDIPANDPDYLAMTTLAALGIINPTGVNGSGRFEPERPVARAEVAAFLARTFGWQGETHPNLFPDQCDPVGAAGCVDDALWQSVAALAQYGVVGGYTDGVTCAASGLPAPCYLPRDPVLRIQIVSIVARAFTKTPALRPTGFWERLPAVSGQYTNVPDSGSPAHSVLKILSAGLGRDCVTNDCQMAAAGPMFAAREHAFRPAP